MNTPETAMSWMRRETMESPDAVARLWSQSGAAIARAGALLRELNPPFIALCARGSSDHAAIFFKYACESLLGLPVVSVGPSIASIYQTPLRAKGAAMLLISQSGRSPDLLALAKNAQAGGAKVISIVNDAQSPAAELADLTIPLAAGPEKSVAATKSCLSSMAAGLGILAEFAGHDELRRALADLPADLAKALRMDWSALPATFHAARSALVIGRGMGLPIAMEAALKLKETAALHAEPYSAAEVLHGPIEIVDEGFPVLMFRQDDASAPSLDHCAKTLRAAGAKVLVTGRDLPMATGQHPATALIAAMASGYLAIEQVSLGRKLDPDHPRLLKKVTETV
ncbi:SIS domain-containing protein [Dongia rigui]|uniref:SIS domain-containing protein n=1 Tax=Dongia rigui TaxID=940149 RepID=A0ABU5DZF3_9PROT|nr:SIS domain-containing protein [Dongia rigui]MDY0872681.1 SIS domain-containing protein [Dongia rigui]